MKHSDKHYIEGFIKRKEHIIGDFYIDMKEGSTRMINKFNIPAEKVDELYHDALLQCIDNVLLGKFKGKSALSTYFLSILKYKCLSSFKRKHQRCPALGESP